MSMFSTNIEFFFLSMRFKNRKKNNCRNSNELYWWWWRRLGRSYNGHMIRFGRQQSRTRSFFQWTRTPPNVPHDDGAGSRDAAKFRRNGPRADGSRPRRTPYTVALQQYCCCCCYYCDRWCRVASFQVFSVVSPR